MKKDEFEHKELIYRMKHAEHYTYCNKCKETTMFRLRIAKDDSLVWKCSKCRNCYLVSDSAFNNHPGMNSEMCRPNYHIG